MQLGDMQVIGSPPAKLANISRTFSRENWMAVR